MSTSTTSWVIQGDATHLPLADQSVDLLFTSPPYVDARTYGIGAQRHCIEWVDWMLKVVREGCRVSRGLVLINCAGVTRKHRYQPAPEMLLSEWWKQGGECWRPAYWHRVGIPGSGGKQWLRADVEYVLAFKLANGAIPWSDNTACGHVPKWGLGGEMSYRHADGKRRNARTGAALLAVRRQRWGGGGTSFGRRANGEKIAPAGERNEFGFSAISGNGRYASGKPKPLPIRAPRGKSSGDLNENGSTAPPVLANPGNLLKIIVGGGVMGSKLAHENEAPFPEKLPEFFIKSYCPPHGSVLDPFSGSGTTIAVAR